MLCITSTLCLFGCGEQDVASAKIVRDDARTGGTLSFEYDERARIIYIGGEGEVVQYSQGIEELNLSEGCRIGIKVTAPDENLDLENAKLEMNEVKYASGEFLENINGQKQRFFNLRPLVSKEVREVTFKVTWAEGTKEQEYKIVIVDGTKFMNKEGKVE